jgi:hypothetical protein
MVKYIVEGCSDGLEYIVSASTVLSPLQVIDFNFGEDTPICGTVISETDLEPIPLYTYLNSYTGCLSCEPPRSANTEVDMCLEICTPEGNTVVSVNPPHPEWTDGYGTQVTQLNMITLGGQNGLNN